MIDCVEQAGGSTWRITVPMTQAQARGLMLAGQKQLLAPSTSLPITIELGAVEQADSSGLAVLLDWMRSARQQGRPMHIDGMPPALQALADLYGVAPLLQVA